MPNTPAYLKVYHELKEEIKKGTYPILSFLPKESDLERMYQVSRTTVRKAVNMLSDEGILDVRQGRGTMVKDYRARQDYNRVTSVTEALRKKGYVVTTKSMVIDVIEAAEKLSQELEIPIGTKIARVQRLQLADEKPITIMKNYIPYDTVPGLEKHQGKFVALYQFLEENYDFKIESTLDRIFATAATFMEAQTLAVDVGTALLNVRRICYDGKKPVCVDRVRIIGSQYEVEIRGKGRMK